MWEWAKKHFRPPRQDAKRDEFWRSYRERLCILLSTFFGSEPDNAEAKAEIARMLEETKNDPSAHFEKLYSAEQRLILAAPDHFLAAESDRRFTEAELRNIPSRVVLQKRYDESTDTDGRRAALHALVDDIQLFYLNRSIDRRARREASERLNYFSKCIVIPTVVLLILVYLFPRVPFLQGLLTNENNAAGLDGRSLDFVAEYHLLAIMWFGLIGAYFSRLISFQQKSIGLGREDIETEFSSKTLVIRLTIGVVAAIIMYVLLRANMIAGSLFPDWENFNFTEPLTVNKIDRGTVVSSDFRAPTASTFGVPDDATTLASTEVVERQPASLPIISVEFAQLLVWSLLAGFSERLIPDRFASLEQNSVKAS